MKIPFCKSRNFSSYDVARNAQDRETDPVQFYLLAYVHGHAQAVRDGLFKRYGERFKGLTITSANRNGYNNEIAGASKTSHHMYRIDPKTQFLHVAYDAKPLGITLDEFYLWCVANCRGEIYLNKPEGIVHIAPVAMEDEHWIKK